VSLTIQESKKTGRQDDKTRRKAAGKVQEGERKRRLVGFRRQEMDKNTVGEKKN